MQIKYTDRMKRTGFNRQAQEPWPITVPAPAERKSYKCVSCSREFFSDEPNDKLCFSCALDQSGNDPK